MLAIVNTSSSIRHTFFYNENKVKQGLAKCIGENNYPCHQDHMNDHMKLNLFLRQIALNENIKKNTIHISLNFSPADADLYEEKLIRIANTYMEKIGLGHQPYLIYQHFDAGHPHLHIVSITVKTDGGKISLFNAGKTLWKPAQQEIEKSFGLIQLQHGTDSEPLSRSVGRIHYGKTPSVKAIQKVLNHVLFAYKYTSLSELNAILGQYNIRAYRGSNNADTLQNNTLWYQILNKDQKAIGVPINANLLEHKPNLKFLEQRFRLNRNKSELSAMRIRNTINLAMIGKKPDFARLPTLLEKQGIKMIADEKSIIYVDYKAKCVFSELGSAYSVLGLRRRFYEITAKASELIPVGIDSLQGTSNDLGCNPAVENDSTHTARKRRKKRRRTVHP